MVVINMTPHPIQVVDEQGQLVKTYPASGQQIRLKMETVSAGSLPDRTPLSKTVYGEPEGLPNAFEGTYYIVSQLVKNALPEREDLLVPAEIVRNPEGMIIGCRSLGL